MMIESDVNDLKQQVRYLAAKQRALVTVLRKSGVLDDEAADRIQEETDRILSLGDPLAWYGRD